MKIIEYFTSENKAHWLSEIKKADWGAAKFLAHLLSEGTLKETLGQTALVPLLTDGKKWKDEIVSAAKNGIDMTAICGFSCKHCFFGEWCGGCLSVFNCCSFGTMFPGGKCPNVACCKDKKLDGCFDCPDLENCETGFYKHENDDAAACKAQAIFIHRHGKEQFFKAHDNLHKKFLDKA